jgi:hypothetical protein
MEQILAFGLGVGAVAFVWVVVAAFKAASKISKLETNLQDTINLIDDNRKLSYEQCLALDRRIDQEIDRVSTLYTDNIRYIDSRVDKLDAKFCSDGKALTEKSKEFLKG